MTPRLAPLVAGLLAAAATFVVVASFTGGGETVVEPAATVRSPGQAAAGRVVFARMGCGTCHSLAAANAQGQIGPDLDRRLQGHTHATLAAQIVDPYAGGPPVDFATMPEDYGERMSAAELDALVAFLVGAARNGAEGHADR